MERAYADLEYANEQNSETCKLCKKDSQHCYNMVQALNGRASNKCNGEECSV